MSELPESFEPLPTIKWFKNITGAEYGRLKVLGFAGRRTFASNPKKYCFWWCQCKCGRVTKVRAGMLRAKIGASASCGVCTKNEGHVRHGQSRTGRCTKEYKSWLKTKSRCHNTKNRQYPDYGGRGIFVCEEWKGSFAAFFAHMGACPPSADGIDRIDNNKGYEPGNCRWASNAVQARNKRSNRVLTHDGKTMCASAWAELLGISLGTIHMRLKRGWSVERTLSTPQQRRSHQA